MIDMFPEVDVMKRVDECWEFVGGFVPVPRQQLHCPQCRDPEIHLSRMGYHHHETSISDRVDVSFKCAKCSLFWTHGIPIETDKVAAAKEYFGHVNVHWRDVQEFLELFNTKDI